MEKVIRIILKELQVTKRKEMVAKYQIGFFFKSGLHFPREGHFPKKERFGLRLSFWHFGNFLLYAPKHGDPTHIQLTPIYQAHRLASAPRHVEFFYLREQVLFI